MEERWSIISRRSNNNNNISKWLATTGSIWIQAIIGGTYTFSIYSPVLKSSQSYDQFTLNTISVFKDIGSNAGVLSGLLYSSFGPQRYEVPWVVHIIGVAEGFVGYLFMWLAIAGIIPCPPVSLMCVFMFLAAHSQTYFNTWNVVMAVRNFPCYGGTLVGLMKGMEKSYVGNNKWIAAAGSIWIQALIGGTYIFSTYSPILKSSQSYDQSTLDTIAVFKDTGSNAGVLSSLLYTYGPHHRYGVPWVVHLVGATEGFLGYFGMWLAVVGLIPRPPVPLMCVFMFLAAHSQTFFNTWNVVTSVQNFPHCSGTVVGLMKGFLGLSGAILIQVYKAFFKGDPSTYILMLALLPSIVSLSLMSLVRLCPDDKTVVDDKNHLNAMSIVSMLLAVYLMIILMLQDIFVFPHWARLLSFLILLIMLSMPLKIATEATKKQRSQSTVLVTEPLLFKPDATYPQKLVSEENVELCVDSSLNLLEAMGSFNFWLLFLAILCGMGSGLATINNMSQLGQSLGYNTTSINTLVSLWSIWNFFGRFGAGYISDILLHQKGWARPLVMAIALGAMSVGHVIIGSAFIGNLYIGTILVGICYGAQWCLMPTITSEIFGVLHMGTIYNAIAVASPLGTYVLSVWVIGHNYDKEAGEHNSCYGAKCFRVSFFALAFVSFFGCLVALMLYFRTRVFYRSVVLRRLHSSARS